MATQLSVIRGDILPTQTVTVTSDTLDFTNMLCTGQLRTHPDGNLVHQFVPTILMGIPGTGVVSFDISGQYTKNFPPINLYGDIHYTSDLLSDRTLYEFRLNVLLDVTRVS